MSSLYAVSCSLLPWLEVIFC